MHICIHLNFFIYIYTYVYTYINTYIYIYIYIYVYPHPPHSDRRPEATGSATYRAKLAVGQGVGPDLREHDPGVQTVIRWNK